IKHHLHPKKADTSISPEIKQFILDNIDLLPREIYKRLVEQGLNINIRQKQRTNNGGTKGEY
ncbi:4620_t:CDS:2, partial [Rhizophagus irregularis]